MTFYCPAQTYRGSLYEPNEFCETEVAEEGDLCPIHDAHDHEDDTYERLRDARYDD